MTAAELRKTFPNKAERLIENQRLTNLAHKEAARREKILSDYVNSNKVKQLKRAVQKANDAVNDLIGKWNDIIMEDHNPPGCRTETENNYTSVDGELRLNYKDDPKSW